MSKLKRVGRWIFWPLFALLVAALAFFFWSENPLLGRWVEAGSEGNPSGIEFFRTRRFATFGLQRDGIPTGEFGSYSFISSNQVKLVVTRFRTRIGNTETNIAIKPMPPLFDPNLEFMLSNDGQRLEKIDGGGWEGGTMTLYKQ